MANAIGTAQIGSGFGLELLAAGLSGVQLGWSPTGEIIYGPDVTDAEKAAVQAVYAAHNPIKGGLIDYANARQWQLATGGYIATIAGAPRFFTTDQQSMTLISGKTVRFQQPEAPTSVNWQIGPTTFISIAAADFVAAATKIADFVQATFDTLNAVMAGIESGAITTTMQIDSAAWPANHD